MGFEWPTKSFAELISSDELEIGDGYRAKNDELGGDGLIFLRAGQVTDSHISFLGIDRFHHEDRARFGEKISQSGDVVITTKGNSTGRVSAVTPEMPSFVYSPHLSYWRTSASGCLKQSFLRAWSRAPEFLTQLSALSRSTDMAPYLSLTDQRRLNITIPPLEVQSWIGCLSSAIEERIDLLRRTNATLEAIAQTLFKSWFADFDPVRAKAEGREPEGMDAATAALFPSEFDDSALGRTPKGWRVGTLEDLLVLQRGFDLPAKQRSGDDYPVIAASGPSGTHSKAMVKGPGVVTGRSGVLGKVFIELGDFWPLNTTLWVREFKAASPCFAYELLRRLDLQQFNAGSAVPTLNRNHVHGLLQVVPPAGCVNAFEEIAAPIRRCIRNNFVQSQSLADLRDTLLPRLISGKLRLPEAEAIDGESAVTR